MHEVIKLNCLQCGTPFERQWPNAKQIYCSPRCNQLAWNAANKEKRRAYVAKSIAAHKRQHGKTYSQEWIAENKGLIRAREKQRLQSDPEFRRARNSRQKARRKLKLSKRPRICADCGSRKMVGCHHANFNVFDNDLQNLVWLCHWCHMRRHWEEDYGS